MKIKCIKCKILLEAEQHRSNINAEKIFDLEIGKTYIVYALGFFEDGLWYCICDESFSYYPVWLPSVLFEIVNNLLSRYWIFSIYKNGNEKIPLLAFPEWANGENFYEDLVDGYSNDSNAIIFKKYKELMDLEFPDSSISEVAQIGDAEWLICPKCIDAWESRNDRDALVKCPKCQTIFNNPRYKDVLPRIA